MRILSIDNFYEFQSTKDGNQSDTDPVVYETKLLK